MSEETVCFDSNTLKLMFEQKFLNAFLFRLGMVILQWVHRDLVNSGMAMSLQVEVQF